MTLEQIQSESQSACSVIFPTVVNKGILCPRQAYTGPGWSALSGFDASEMSHSLQTHDQAKCNDPFCLWSMSLIQTMHECLVVTQLSTLEN